MGLLLQSGEIHHRKMQDQNPVSSGHKHIKQLFHKSGMFLAPLYANADGFHRTLFEVFTPSVLRAATNHLPILK